MKNKETLKQAKENAWDNLDAEAHQDGDEKSAFDDGFELGAKRQQQQEKNKYNEEDLIGFAEWVIYEHITLFRDNPEQLLEIYKKEKGLI